MFRFQPNKLEFDTTSLIDDLKQVYAEEIADICDWLADQAMAAAPKEVDRSQIESEVTELANEIIGQVTSGGMWALITEWGSGSKMDMSNPGLADYRNSPYWNPVRRGTAIVGRPQGPYIDINNRIRRSHGRWEGKDLEKGIYSKGELVFKAEPQPAQHWLRNLIELSEPQIIRRLVAVLERFEIHKCFG